MNCTEFEAALSELVELHGGQLSDRAVAHRYECRECAKRWSDHVLLQKAIRAWLVVEPSHLLTESVLRQLVSTAVSKPALSNVDVNSKFASSNSGRWVVAATVACIAMASWIAGQSQENAWKISNRAGGRFGGTRVVVPDARIQVRESVGAILADIRAEYRNIADETSATARELASAIPLSVAWSEALDADNAGGVTPKSAGAIGRTIGDQVGQAIGFLWQTVPSDVPAG